MVVVVVVVVVFVVVVEHTVIDVALCGVRGSCGAYGYIRLLTLQVWNY